MIFNDFYFFFYFESNENQQKFNIILALFAVLNGLTSSSPFFTPFNRLPGFKFGPVVNLKITFANIS